MHMPQSGVGGHLHGWVTQDIEESFPRPTLHPSLTEDNVHSCFPHILKPLHHFAELK